MAQEVMVEAVLFSAGKPVSVEEIAQTVSCGDDAVRACLKRLMDSYEKRGSAIEIAKVGSKYVMQLRPDLAPKAVKIAPAVIPKPILKTAALIAYHQPIRQSTLMTMVGGKVYDHVKYLSDCGLISTKKFAHTLILTTSNRFPEYFGIPTSKRDDIRRWIAQKVGIKFSPKDKKIAEAESKEIEKAMAAGPDGGTDGSSQGTDSDDAAAGETSAAKAPGQQA